MQNGNIAVLTISANDASRSVFVTIGYLSHFLPFILCITFYFRDFFSEFQYLFQSSLFGHDEFRCDEWR